MKIKKLRLKNFSIIKACMNMDELLIDFTKSNNILQLLVGPSGSGKTGILSCIHPFAYNKLDTDRSDSDLIVSGATGEKELIYQDGKDEIKITHFYEPKGDKRTVKSFIELNGVELNKNGNVTSFNELVKLHFGITTKSLTLLRLGNNVKSLVSSSYTERKDYISSLMSEVDMYLQYHKKVTDDMRYYNSLLRNCIDKITRLHVDNEFEIENEIERIDKEIRLHNAQLADTNRKVGSLKYKLQENNYDQLLLDQRNIQLSIVENNKTLARYSKILEGNTVLESLGELQNKIRELEVVKNTNETIISMNLAKLNNLFQSKEDKQSKLGKVISKFNKEEIKAKLAELYDKRNNTIVKHPMYDYSEEELFQILTMAQDIYNNMKDIDGIDRIALTEVIDARKQGRNPEGYALRQQQKYQDKINYCESRIRNLTALGGNMKNDEAIYIMYTPEQCKVKDCPYKAYYEDNNCDDKDSEIDKLKEEIRKHKISLDLFTNMYNINQKIGYILMLVKSNQLLFNRGAKDMINQNKIFEYLLNDDDYYRDLEIYFTEEIDIVHKKKEYEILNKDIDEFERELEILNLNSESIDMLEKDLQEIEKEIQDTNTDYFNRKTELESAILEISELNNKKMLREAFEEALSNKEDLERKITQLTMEERKLGNKLSELSTVKTDLTRELGNIQALENHIAHFRKDQDELRYRILEFRKLQSEKEELESEYNKIKYIKKSLSSKEGMPLLYQNVYLKDTTAIMNELLDIAYGGELRVEPFVINDKEFRIPFRRHGVVISDISAASQGETSMIVAALSFALIKQSLYKYNIILLDEIDGPLDEELRSRFLEIIEAISQLIDSEQVFIISHNNTYNNYPVDVITTGENKLDFKNANIIFER